MCDMHIGTSESLLSFSKPCGCFFLNFHVSVRWFCIAHLIKKLISRFALLCTRCMSQQVLVSSPLFETIFEPFLADIRSLLLLDHFDEFRTTFTPFFETKIQNLFGHPVILNSQVSYSIFSPEDEIHAPFLLGFIFHFIQTSELVRKSQTSSLSLVAAPSCITRGVLFLVPVALCLLIHHHQIFDDPNCLLLPSNPHEISPRSVVHLQQGENPCLEHTVADFGS